jgi:hypothetical protein
MTSLSWMSLLSPFSSVRRIGRPTMDGSTTTGELFCPA